MNIPAPTKHFFRQRQSNRLYEEVVKAIEDAANRDDVRRKDIAEHLGVSASQVSRWLSGPSNWGIDTVSDLLFAIGAELDFNVTRFADRQRGNEFHPAGEPHDPSRPPTFAKTQTDAGESANVTIPAEIISKLRRSTWTMSGPQDG